MEEKNLILKELEKIPKPGEMEKKMRLLRESTEELHKEVMQKKLEIKNLWEDLTSKQKQLLKEQKELEELLEYQVTLKVCSFNSYICNHCICKDMKMHEYRCTLH